MSEIFILRLCKKKIIDYSYKYHILETKASMKDNKMIIK